MKFHEGLGFYWQIRTHLSREVCPHPFGLFECSNLFGRVLPKGESTIRSRTAEIAGEWCEGSPRLPEPGALCHLVFSPISGSTGIMQGIQLLWDSSKYLKSVGTLIRRQEEPQLQLASSVGRGTVSHHKSWRIGSGFQAWNDGTLIDSSPWALHLCAAVLSFAFLLKLSFMVVRWQPGGMGAMCALIPGGEGKIGHFLFEIEILHFNLIGLNQVTHTHSQVKISHHRNATGQLALCSRPKPCAQKFRHYL